MLAPSAVSATRAAPGQLGAGALIAPLHLTSIAGEAIDVPDPARIVHLQFRRFAGCPVCSMHLRAMAPRAAEIEAAGVREVVLFYSTAEDIRRHLGGLPFTFVADAERHIYRRLGVHSAPRSLLSPRAWGPIFRAVGQSLAAMARGAPMPPLNPRGGRFGLPADFLIAGDGRVIQAKYGEHVNDQWSADQVLQLVRAWRATQGTPAGKAPVTG